MTDGSREGAHGLGPGGVHPVATTLRCRCHVADEDVLWDWLVEQVDARHVRVSARLLDRSATREAVIDFASDLDARRFRLWAERQGFRVVDLGSSLDR